MDGEKLVDTRHYSVWLQSGKPEKMTAGSQVPYSGPVYSTTTGQTKSVQYRSVGVSLMSAINEIDGSPWLDLQLDVSDVAPPEKGADPSTPVFRSININSKAVLTLGKPVTVGSVEDPTSKRRFQVDATATKLK